MSRTREIKGWIYNNEYSFNERFPDNFNEMVGVSKATLIIELPECKVTISESKIRDCYDSFRTLNNQEERTLVYSFFEHVKNELFKDAE